MEKKDNIILTIVILLSIIMIYSLFQSFFYEKGTVGSNFWRFVFITGVGGLGSIAVIMITGMITQNFEKADALNNSEIEDRSIKTLIKIKFKYIVVILFYIGFFSTMGTFITYLATTSFIEPGIFPVVLFYFLLITGIIMIYFFGFILIIYDAKSRLKET